MALVGGSPSSMGDFMNDITDSTSQSVNERAKRLGPDWDLNASDLAWVSNYRDWDDVFRDVWGFCCKPLRLLKRWLR